MENELKEEKVDETTNQPAQVDEKKSEASKVDDNDLKKKDDNSSEANYETELARIREERDNYKQGMMNAKKENKDLKAQSNDNHHDESQIDDGIEDRIVSKLAKMQETNMRNWEMERLSDENEELIDSYSSDKNERELIKYHLNNTVRISGTDRKSREEAVQTAKLIANRHNIERDNAELRASLKAKSQTSVTHSEPGTPSNSSHVDTSQFSSADKILLERHNISLKDAAKRISQNS